MVVVSTGSGNETGPEWASPFPRRGTKPYLIPYGSIPAHSRSRGAGGAGGGRRGTSPTGTATTSHFSSAVSAAFSPVSRRHLLLSPSRVSWFRWPVGHGAAQVRAGAAGVDGLPGRGALSHPALLRRVGRRWRRRRAPCTAELRIPSNVN
jgi:hypothetical protein